jgi:hypothetical protein
MTDFLDQLLGRSAGELRRWDAPAVQTVRPSIPSIYSPAPDLVETGMLEVEGGPAVSRPPAARAEAPSRERPGPSQARSTAAPEQVTSTRVETTVERRTVELSFATPPQPAERVVPRAAPSEVPAPPRSALRPAMDPPEGEPAAPRRRVEPGESVAVTRQSPPSANAGLPSLQAAPAPRTEPLAERPAPRPSSRDGERREPVARPAVRQPEPPPLLPLRAVPASAPLLPSAPPPRPAPRIEVSIGRIDIRAAPAAAPPPRRPAAAPVLGLDEYLRLRSGEPRR